MKKPNPPLELIEREKFIGNLKYWRRISKLWGFQSSGGVRVYWKQQTYYGGSVSPGFYKFLDLIGSRSMVNHSKKGIKRAWLYLNRSKADRKMGVPVISHPATIASNVNKRIRSNISGTVFVAHPRIQDGLFDVNKPRPELPAWYDPNIPDHPRRLLAEWISEGMASIPNTPADNPHDDVVLIFAPYMNRLASITRPPVQDTYLTEEVYVTTVCDSRTCWTEAKTRQARVQGWSFSITVPATSQVLSNDDPFIQAIYNEGAKVAPEATQNPAFQGEPSAGNPYNEIWYGGYLREDFLRYTGMKVVDKIDYFFAAIDNGYKKKKKKKGFKSFIGIIIAIVIVIVAFWTGQWYAASAGFTIGAGATVAMTVVGLAVVVVVAATVISIALMVGNMLGLSEYMGPLAAFMNMMAPLVRIAQIITIIYTIVNIFQQVAQSAGQQAAQQAAAQQGTQQTTNTLGQQAVQGVAKPTIQNYVKAAFDVAKENIIGSGPVGEFSAETVNKVVKVADYMANKYYESKNEKMMRELNKESVLLAQEKELAEQFQTNHLLMDMIRTEPLLSAAGESQYVEIYDRPYEWWSTPFHTGCMQANTVHAMIYLDP